MSSNTNNSTIAKNTVFLYVRMAITILVGLYTSRVILNTLGVEDYGIYNVAGSVVMIWYFIAGALGQSSSRHITFQLGRIDIDGKERLKECFGTTKVVMACMAGVIVLISETLGVWILYNKSGIPVDRMIASFWTFQLSVLTSVFSITQIPYTALIISHERMKIYAYVSVVEALAKLGVCYLLIISPIDKLIFYSILLCIVQVSIMLFYRLYCRKNFVESSAEWHVSKDFFKPILSFSGWSLLGGASSTLFAQVSNIVISAFFNPSIVAAKAVATQVRGQASNFVSGFRTAANPQIIKRFSEGNIKGYKKLLFQSTNISFYLMLLIVLPIFFEAEPILKLWLKTVPDYTLPFVRISLIEGLFSVYDLSFFMIFQATGRLKENAIICPLLDVIVFAIIIVFFYSGGSPLYIAWGLLFLSVVEGMILKPYLAVRFFEFKWSDFFSTFGRNGLVAIVSCIAPTLLVLALDENKVISAIVIVLTTIITTAMLIFYVGMGKDQRAYLVLKVKNKIGKY